MDDGLNRLKRLGGSPEAWSEVLSALYEYEGQRKGSGVTLAVLSYLQPHLQDLLPGLEQLFERNDPAATQFASSLLGASYPGGGEGEAIAEFANHRSRVGMPVNPQMVEAATVSFGDTFTMVYKPVR